MINTAFKRKKGGSGHRPGSVDERSSRRALIDCARMEPGDLLRHLGSSPDGLSDREAALRLRRLGPNSLAADGRRSVPLRILDNIRNPLVILLIVLGAISYATGDIRATIMISVMVVLGVVLRFAQEARSDRAAEKLKSLVAVSATVIRDGVRKDVPASAVVPGDILLLSAGDMVPADVRLLEARDLHLDQAALTGESMPAEKSAGTADADDAADPLALPMLCFEGTNVQTGSATAVVILTGGETTFGRLAGSVAGERAPTGFDAGIDAFTWLIIRLMVVLVPLVFLLNGFSRGNWLEAFLFALAVAVGLTPEMLPMIVTVNLSKGALAMARRKVIVRRLDAIQNLGAMDVLCTDKTGTLTEGRIVLIRHVDVEGNEREEILRYAYLNSYFETGLKNVMDLAVLEHDALEREVVRDGGYTKVDEIPFDFERRRLSVVVDGGGGRMLICKGAVEEVIAHCSHIMVEGKVLPLDASHHYPLSERLVAGFNEEGFRVVALAFRSLTRESRAYSVEDEAGLTLTGYLAFLDPPKESAAEALRALRRSHIAVKLLTGDNGAVAASICRQVELPVDGVLLGSAIDAMDDASLDERVEGTTIFAKLSPAHKERVIAALRRRGHVVGCMGDGINDAPALKGSDVGISVDTAVDIARESSDIILLERSLLVLNDGVTEGRKVFGNVVKYIEMAASSNFGNMFSVVGTSVVLPFLPMLPIQVLTNNLLYDLSQTTIPTDAVDPEWLTRPRAWSVDQIRRFILRIGPISSIFDYITFFIMLRVFDCWKDPALFHTGWFVESLFTQTLIIHVIRTEKIPFIESRASTPLMITSALILALGGWLPYSPLAASLGLVPLPGLYWALLGVMLLCYLALTQGVKGWLLRREG